MRVLPMGPSAVLVEQLEGPPAVVGETLRRRGIPGVVDIVPAAETLLVTVDRADALGPVVEALHTLDQRAPVDPSDGVVEIPVVYDGDDLSEVAGRVAMTVDELIDRHVGATYRVAFCGFAPGFAYLDGLPPELHLARRSTPRTRVPAGSVAIAAGFSAVYPTASPGGWHLLGSTDAVLFDVDRDPPASLTPGATVRFVRR